MQGAHHRRLRARLRRDDNKFSGGAFDWLTPFSVVTALALVSGYVLLSAGWLIMKGDEALREWAYDIAYTR